MFLPGQFKFAIGRYCIHAGLILFGLAGLAQAGPIHDAARAGNLSAVQKIVVSAPEPRKAINEPDSEGYTALHWAVVEGRIELMPWLLKNGADVTLRTNQQQETPLLLAGRHGRPQTARFLLEAGASVDDANAQMETAVTLAAANGHPEVIKVLLQHGANVNGTAGWCSREQEPYCESGPLPLNVAVRHGHREVVELLIARGSMTRGTLTQVADPGMVKFLLGLLVLPDDSDLLEAVRRKDIELLKLLLSRTKPDGASLDALRVIGNLRDRQYDTAQVVGLLPEREALRLLLERAPGASREVPTLLHAAVVQDVSAMSLLLAKGFAANARDPFGNTPLHWAATGSESTKDREQETSAQSIRKISILLDHGADVNARNDWGNTPLHRATPGNLRSVVRYLADRGANVNAANELGVTPLHMAAVRGYNDIVRLLLQRKANPNARMERGTQPLHAAAAAAQADTVRLLIEHGAEVNGQAKHQMTPLHYALAGSYNFSIEERDGQRYAWFGRYGHRDSWVPEQSGAQRLSTVRLLIAHGAKVNALTEWSATPLHLAVAGYGSLPVTYLKNEPGPKTGYLGPHWDMNERAEAIKLLLAAGASTRPLAKPGYPSPLAMACAQLPATTEIVRLLADRAGKAGSQRAEQLCDSPDTATGVPVDPGQLEKRDQFGFTMLHRAVQEGDTTLVTTLLQQGANPNAETENRNQGGWPFTPLHSAARGKPEIVKLLLAHGAKVDRSGATGATPLHHAIDAARPENVRLLLEHGANPNATDYWGSTPLHRAVFVASLPGAMECMRLLLQYGADSGRVDKGDKTPMDLARERNNPDVLKLLTESRRTGMVSPRIPPASVSAPARTEASSGSTAVVLNVTAGTKPLFGIHPAPAWHSNEPAAPGVVLKHPVQVENGEIVPLLAEITPVLRAGDQLTLFVNDQRAATVRPTGSVVFSGFSARFRLPTPQGEIRAIVTRQDGSRQAAVAPMSAAVPAVIPAHGTATGNGQARVLTRPVANEQELLVLLNNGMALSDHARQLLLRLKGGTVEVTLTPWLSRDPLLGIRSPLSLEGAQVLFYVQN